MDFDIFIRHDFTIKIVRITDLAVIPHLNWNMFFLTTPVGQFKDTSVKVLLEVPEQVELGVHSYDRVQSIEMCLNAERFRSTSCKSCSGFSSQWPVSLRFCFYYRRCLSRNAEFVDPRWPTPALVFAAENYPTCDSILFIVVRIWLKLVLDGGLDKEHDHGQIVW